MQNGVKKITNALYDVSCRLKIRASIIESIVKAETQYVKTLKYIVDVIRPSLECCAEQIEYEIEDGHIRALFGNVSELLDVHNSLLIELEKESGGCGSDSTISSPEEQYLKTCHCCLGKIFANAKDSFKVYDIYCSNHGRAEEVAEEILKMSSLQSVVKKWDENLPFPKERTKGSNTLVVCLKEPLLYLCNTSVFLKMLSVFTSIGDDLPDVLGSYSIVHATMTGIDPEKRQKLLQDSYALCDNLKEEWDNSGLLNKQGFLTKRGGNIKSWKIRWFTLRSYEMKYFEEPVDEKSLGTLNLKECTKVFEADSQSKPNCFGISKKELEEGAIQLLNVVYWQRSWDYCNIDKQRLTTLNHDSTDTEIEPKPLTTKFFASSQQLQHCTAEDII